MNSESLIIQFDGQEHQIDANTLVNTLIHYNALINQVNEIVGSGQKKIELKVNALERGSFVIDISLITTFVENLFKPENIAYAAGIVTIIGGVFKAYKHFKGKPAKNNDSDVIKKVIEENNIKIENSTFIAIYNNPVVRSSISKSIETATSDSAVEGITILNHENPVANIKREEFSELVYDDFDKETEQPEIKHETKDDAVLGIITLSFDTRKNWEFIYDGFKINMPMRDSVLSSLIDNGMRFAKGDAIVVKLEITKQYNPVYNAYQNKKFRIVEFIKHIPRPEMASLFQD